ncbi:hypothetical protein IAR55_004432 [Kwoniella newhampshirensis]|uniref:Uncharacterized protein n=1 Tax=Kwoniella newhampshirensis TaxID=1651941 RepID=A0AAW0YXP2_9TREE
MSRSSNNPFQLFSEGDSIRTTHPVIRPERSALKTGDDTTSQDDGAVSSEEDDYHSCLGDRCDHAVRSDRGIIHYRHIPVSHDGRSHTSGPSHRSSYLGDARSPAPPAPSHAGSNPASQTAENGTRPSDGRATETVSTQNRDPHRAPSAASPFTFYVHPVSSAHPETSERAPIVEHQLLPPLNSRLTHVAAPRSWHSSVSNDDGTGHQFQESEIGGLQARVRDLQDSLATMESNARRDTTFPGAESPGMASFAWQSTKEACRI